MRALLHLVPPTLQQTTTNPCLCQRLLDTHRQIWVRLLWGHCSFPLGSGAYKVLFVTSGSLFPHLCKFWQLYGGVNDELLQEGLCHTQVCCTQGPCFCSRPLLTHTSTGVTQTLKSRSGSVGSPDVHKVLLVPSKSLWQVWGLILNMILPILPSCWGFSFALGHGVSVLGGIQHSLVNGCSAVCCNCWVVAGEDEHTSFYSAILCHLYFCNSGVCLSSQAAIIHSTIVFWKFLYPGFKLPVFNAQTSPSHASTVHVPWASRCSSWI